MAHWIYQTLWTRPLQDKQKEKILLRIAALSLEYAHASGYKVRLHTDTRGAELVKEFPYDKVLLTLDEIPDTVPPELFAAGKFYAMRAEGCDSVHIDLDVFLKKPCLDRFFNDSRWDVIVQSDEYNEPYTDYINRSRIMHIMGYPIECHPSWKHSYNVGVIGFHNLELFNRYIGNYFEALEIYTTDTLQQFRKDYPEYSNEWWHYQFDFNLEQQTIHWMTIGKRVMTLIEDKYANDCANAIGYAHLQGAKKWYPDDRCNVMPRLRKMNPTLAASLE